QHVLVDVQVDALRVRSGQVHVHHELLTGAVQVHRHPPWAACCGGEASGDPVDLSERVEGPGHVNSSFVELCRCSCWCLVPAITAAVAGTFPKLSRVRSRRTRGTTAQRAWADEPGATGLLQ